MWIRIPFMALLFAATAWAEPSLQDDLLLYFNFDQDEGDSVTDQSGHGRHARVQGPRWIADGARGGAYHFQHEGDTIATSDDGLPMGDAPRTLSWWFSLDSLRPIKHSTEMINYGNLAPAQFFVAAMDWRIGRDCPILSPWGWVFISQRRIERTQQWHHAVLTYAGRGRFAYYIDGVLCPGINEQPRAINTQPGGYFRMGRFSPEVHGLDGRIDEVRLYGRVLASDEVTQLYLQGSESVRAQIDAGAVPRVANAAHAAAREQLQQQAATGSDSGTTTGAAAEGRMTGTLATDHQVTRIGFSTQADGERDVTVFYTDETLHVWVQDVDLDAQDTNILVKASVYQRDAHEGKAEVSVELTAQPDGSFKAELPLNALQPGRALVDLAGYDLSGRVLRLFRTAPITLRDPREIKPGL